MSFKIGDKVKIRDNMTAGCKYGDNFYVSDMAKYKGRNAVITNYCAGDFRLDIDKGRWWWSSEMLEVVPSPKTKKGVLVQGYSLDEVKRILLAFGHPFGDVRFEEISSPRTLEDVKTDIRKAMKKKQEKDNIRHSMAHHGNSTVVTVFNCKKVYGVGVSHCHPFDTKNDEIGELLAFSRAYKLKELEEELLTFI